MIKHEFLNSMLHSFYEQIKARLTMSENVISEHEITLARQHEIQAKLKQELQILDEYIKDLNS